MLYLNSQHQDLCRLDTSQSNRDTEVEDQSWMPHTEKLHNTNKQLGNFTIMSKSNVTAVFGYR